MVERLKVRLQYGRVDRPIERGRIVGAAQQEVVAQRLAEQARHLWCVGAARRDEELPRIIDRPAVPTDLTALFRQQAE